MAPVRFDTSDRRFKKARRLMAERRPEEAKVLLGQLLREARATTAGARHVRKPECVRVEVPADSVAGRALARLAANLEEDSTARDAAKGGAA